MAKVQHSMQALAAYLPAGSFDLVVYYLNLYKVELTVARARNSILGNYKSPYLGKSHRISVNGNLNKYSFLITLIHELAHLQTFEKFANRVLPHGKEWQNDYSKLLGEFIQLNIFPADILLELRKTMAAPAASCAGEVALMKVLRNYDPQQDGVCLLEELAEGERFVTKNGRVFVKGALRRKRFVCKELNSGSNYLINGMCEVKKYPLQ